MASIAPAVLSENADDFKQRIEALQPFAQRLHIDISDGEFAPSFTVTSSEIWWPTDIPTDVHAMVARPSEHLAILGEKKPNMIIFHAEVQEDLTQSLQWLKQVGIRAGIALLKSTVPATVAPLIQMADHVMIFSGDLGHYGGTASMMQLEKVRLIRAINPNVEIGWDGGVTVDNAYSLSQGGIDVLNVGGTIAKSADPAATYQTLVSEINKRGII